MSEGGAAAGATRHAVTLVGRDREVRVLLEALEDALAGRGGLVLLAGDPGIGKSRLADEIARAAAARGAEVLWGRCWEAGGAPAFWPWVQSLRTYVTGHDLDHLVALSGKDAAGLAQLLPELRDTLGDGAAWDTETEGTRFQLFDSIASFLRRAARERPIVVILDDLHAADVPSLLLLRFVADTLADARLLIVGAYRDVEVGPDDPLAAIVADLARLPASRQLTLGGMTQADVARYIEASTGLVPAKQLVQAVHPQTDGNPLFVGQVVHLLAAEGRLRQPAGLRQFSMPRGIHEAIARRLRRLSAECVQVLSLASVLGREFAFAPLAELSELAESELFSLLDEAIAAGVLNSVAVGRLRFSHALVRDSLYDGLPTPIRLELHSRIGDMLESLHAGRIEPHVAELAHHFFLASTAGRGDAAVRYCRLAADLASSLHAFEEAARLYGRALEALELCAPHDPDAQFDLLLAVGDAETRAGDRGSAKQSFLAAAELARASASPERLARAALGYGGRFVWEADRGDPHLVPLLEEAIAGLPAEARALPLRARLLARLAAGPLRDEVSRSRRDRSSREALRIARDLGDPNLLAWTLDARHAAAWWPENLDERLAIAAELIDVAGAVNNPERVFQGHHYRFVGMLELGDMPAVRAAHHAQTRVAAELRQPAQLAYVAACETTLATLDGRLDDAERHAGEMFELAQEYGSVADLWRRVQRYAILRARGRPEEAAGFIADALEVFPTYGVFACIHAHVTAEVGDERAAREALTRLADGDFVIAPTEQSVYGLTLLADVAAFLRDVVAAATLYQRLLPFATRAAVSPPDDCTGSVSRALGVLAGTLERWDDAVGHFEDAAAMNARMSAHPWLVRTWVDWARLLILRDAPGDSEAAVELLDRAGQEAARLGLHDLALWVEAAGPSRTPTHAAAGSVFRRDGEYWSITYGGRSFRLQDTKGLRYLAELLGRSGDELHALDLAAAGERHLPPAGRGSAGFGQAPGLLASVASSVGEEILDADARAAYTRRLRDLQGELEEAEDARDEGRAGACRAEMDFLTAELAGALGLGGRARRAPSDAERARQRVTKAVKLAIDRIAPHCPELRDHLRATVHTGTFCRYQPDPRALTHWRT